LKSEANQIGFFQAGKEKISKRKPQKKIRWAFFIVQRRTVKKLFFMKNFSERPSHFLGIRNSGKREKRLQKMLLCTNRK